MLANAVCSIDKLCTRNRTTATYSTVLYQLGRFGLFFEIVANFRWLLRPIFWARDSWNPTLVKRMLKSGSMLVHTMHTAMSGWENEYMRGSSEICQHFVFQCVWVIEWRIYFYYICTIILDTYIICAGLLREMWLLDSFHSNISFSLAFA